MAYSSIEKLNEIEKKACENLMVASVSSSTTEKEFLKIAENYRTDMPSMVGILREYKELIAKLKEDDVNSQFDIARTSINSVLSKCGVSIVG